MNFKTSPNLDIKFSLFDSNLHKTSDDYYFPDPLAKSEVGPIELDQFANECLIIEDLCSSYSIIKLKDHFRLACEKFKEDFKYSYHCFKNSLISRESLDFLISVYPSPLLTKSTRWLLVSFFVEASFHDPTFSKNFCTDSQALNYLQESFAKQESHEGHLNDIFKLIYNIVSDCPTFFPPSYVSKLTYNAFKNKSTPLIVLEKYSYFIMNFLRSYTAQVHIEIYDSENIKMVQDLHKWFSVKYGYTFEHMLWSFYFWYTNSFDFTNIFYETFFFDVIINQLNLDANDVNETCLKISLSVVIMALFSGKQDHRNQIYENVQIHKIISLIFDQNEKINQETKMLSLRLLSNYAACGPDFINNLLENEMQTKILDNFDEMKTPLKIECGYCFSISIIEGNQEQANYFTDENSIQLMLDCLEASDENLNYNIFYSLSKLIDIKSDVLAFIDPSLIDSIANESPSNVGIVSNAQKILSYF